MGASLRAQGVLCRGISSKAEKCQNRPISRVYAGFGGVVLHTCNGKDEFLTPVIVLCGRVWFNTFNFPKTEVGYYEK